MLLAGMLTNCYIIIPASATGGENFSENIPEPITIATWAHTYQSVDEMLEDSDVIVVGTVIGQTVEQDEGLYFTHSYVEGTNDEIYDVLQTGAIINGVEENIPTDVALLENGKDYFLMLNESTNVYHIAGGTQGVGEYDAQTDIVYSLNCNTRSLFSSMEISRYNNSINVLNVSDPIMTTSDPNLYPSYCIWYTDEVSYYVHSISSSFGSSTYSNICQGAENWNGLANISVVQTNSAIGANVSYSMGDFYLTDWVGITQYVDYTEDGTMCVLEKVNIRLNYAYDQQNIYNKFWQAISCHEMGHALGLAHDSRSTQNIMNGEIYGLLVNGERFYRPSSYDADALFQKYLYN